MTYYWLELIFNNVSVLRNYLIVNLKLVLDDIVNSYEFELIIKEYIFKQFRKGNLSSVALCPVLDL